ncbi:hypothetical protein CSPX01_14466 [Colletotrichum filicis]|nr:hypothetical protein CSPX01_14466 [Colletotrichum filicis]
MWAGGKTLRHQAILRLKALICIPVLLIFYCVVSAMLWQWLGPMVSNAGGYSGRPESSKTCVKSSLSRTPELGLDVSKTLARASAGLARLGPLVVLRC